MYQRLYFKLSPLLAGLLLLVACAQQKQENLLGQPLTPVTIAQYGHVFLYMPLYVAVDKGFFKEEGLNVKLVSTGGDEKTFTAVSSGNAQFGVADPVFAAIARERGQGGKVVAAIVKGVPFWIVSYEDRVKRLMRPEDFAGYRIATYTAPSTCYAVMSDILKNNGHPVDGKIVQGAFGSLQAMLKANQADMAMEIEPIVSTAIAQGAHIVYSPAHRLGDFAFTGLTVCDDFCKQHPEIIQSTVNAIARAMHFIQSDFPGTLLIAKEEFPEVQPEVVRGALMRLREDGTTPLNPFLEKKAWEHAITLRQELGDLKRGGSYEENVDMTFVKKANEKLAAGN